MVESGDSPTEYEWRYDLATGIRVLCPTGWYFDSNNSEDNDSICFTPEPHDHEGMINMGFAINVYPTEYFNIRKTPTGYRKFTEKLPTLIIGIKPTGPLSELQTEGNLLTRSQNFHADSAVYTFKRSENTEESFLMPERLLKTKLIIDTLKNRVYVARFVTPADKPENLSIAETVFESIEIH